MPDLNPLLGFATAILTLINTEKARKYVNALYELEKDIDEELRKSYEKRNDPKLEALFAERKITVKAAEDEVRLFLAKR